MNTRIRRTGSLLALAAGLAIAGCDDPGPKLTVTYIATQGSERVLREAAQFQGPIPVHIDGQPFGTDEEAMSRRAAQWIAAAADQPDWRFQPAGRLPRGSDGVRMVLSFDPETGFSGVSLCQGKSLAQNGGPDPMTARLVICEDDRRAAEALLTLPRPEGADAQGLRDLISQATRAVIQREQERKR